ncbi:MAG: class I SAM-dependent rRNA methyltransferase [Candidatus Rifleibacteriota bacterium]
MKNNDLFLKKNREFSILKGHPWVYQEAFREVPSSLKAGEQVNIYSHKEKFLGIGYIDPESKILVRMIPAGTKENLPAAISRLVREAVILRKELFRSPETNAFRLINGEGDFLPGLIIDRYADALSMQIYSLGLEPYIDLIVNEIAQLLPNIKWIWKRNHIRLAKQKSEGLIKGKNLPSKIIFLENGMKFSTDLVNGQKTGFFLDQRDNRNLIRSLAAGKDVLNICGYTGAFTVAAAAGGAASSITVDIAAPALEEAEANFRLNNVSTDKHRLICADMYEFLQQNKHQHDLVVLDPPSMAKNRRDSEKAVRAYQKLNIYGMKAVKKGGLLFTASCTSQIGREDFLNAVRDAAFKANRRIQIIKETFHAFDHPIALAHSEGRYLKGLLLKVY